MGRNLLGMWMAALALCGLALGCDGGDGGADAGPGETDAGPVADSGPRRVCPTTNVPAPEELMGACCWRHSNAEQLATPELRLAYLQITAPEGSTLTSVTLTSVLNTAMQQETFNWLVRGEGSEGDGPATLVTGFGRRQADGTYAFSGGAADGDPDTWCPVTLDGTVTGENLTTSALEGSVTVPIFDEEGENVQLELTLRQVEITSAVLSEDRSCVGVKVARPFTYTPAGTLQGFIVVAGAIGGEIVVPGIETTVCTAIAGEDLGDADYCETTPQGEWATPPDSICNATGCTQNTPGTTDACDPANGTTGCNAWRIVANFAAAGVDITNSACGS